MPELGMCASRSAKEMMLKLINQKKPHELLAMTMTDVVDNCEDLEVLTKAMKTAEAGEKVRSAPEPWPNVILHEEGGKTREGSLSGLFKDTFGVPVTEDKVCRLDPSGKQAFCRSLSAVENWQSQGYTVHGNGDEAPTVKPGMSTGQIDKMFKDWKNKLLAEGKTINIYSPKIVKEAVKGQKKNK